MPTHKSVTLTIGFGLCLLLTASACQSTERNIVRQVDHILIGSSDADELFSLLADTLQLPVAWPMSNYGFFTSGGVAVGNVNLEVFKERGSGDGGARSRFAGMALEPEPLQESLVELEARDIAHGRTSAFTSPSSEGTSTILWRTVMLPTVSSDATMVFLCEYWRDVEAERVRLLDELRSRDGGPLSFDSVSEILYGTTDMERAKDNWQRLLDPLAPSAPGVWHVGAGPAIRVVDADRDGIIGIVVRVSSLARARDFLREHDLRGEDSPDGFTMAGSRLQGLIIRLVEGY